MKWKLKCIAYLISKVISNSSDLYNHNLFLFQPQNLWLFQLKPKKAKTTYWYCSHVQFYHLNDMSLMHVFAHAYICCTSYSIPLQNERICNNIPLLLWGNRPLDAYTLNKWGQQLFYDNAFIRIEWQMADFCYTHVHLYLIRIL